MSLELIKKIFADLPEILECQIHLLNYNHKKSGTSFNCSIVEFEPNNKTNDIVKELSDIYINNKLDKFTDVRKYDGTCNESTIYKIEDIFEEYNFDLNTLFEKIANSNREVNPFDMKAQAYIICGIIENGGTMHQIKLISMNNPITTLKNRYLIKRGKFKEITDKVLNLRLLIDVIIYDKTVYILNMSGEKLFNLERAYKLKCNKDVDDIIKMNIISDNNNFKKIATSGYNPRRFVSFNQTRLDYLNDKKQRIMVANKYNIILDKSKDKLLDTSDEKNVEKIIKVLCNKAMWDIFSDDPVEVDGSKVWNN